MFTLPLCFSPRAISSVVNVEAKSLMDDIQQPPESIPQKCPRPRETMSSTQNTAKKATMGFSTKEALLKLYSGINDLLEEQQCVKDKRFLPIHFQLLLHSVSTLQFEFLMFSCMPYSKKYPWMYDTLYCKSEYTTICWTSAIALLITAVCLIVTFISHDHAR